MQIAERSAIFAEAERGDTIKKPGNWCRMTNEEYRTFALGIPTNPGVYRFLDGNDTILYVGKAKNLLNRLNSYFGDKAHMSAKTKVLTRNAVRIEFTLVNSETDALLLENTFIKKHQPKYNIRLKDEKSPLVYVCIKNERFPRVFMVRKIVKDGSTYIGPYLSKYRIDQILDLVRKLFQLRTCSLFLSEANIQKGSLSLAWSIISRTVLRLALATNRRGV